MFHQCTKVKHFIQMDGINKNSINLYEQSRYEIMASRPLFLLGCLTWLHALELHRQYIKYLYRTQNFID